jgi:hypothetical protein
MTSAVIQVNDTNFPGFVSDGRDVTPVYEQVLDLAEAISYTNGNVAKIEWPPGRIGLRKPRPRKWYDPSVSKAVVLGWKGQGPGVTTFVALEDVNGNLIDHYKSPSAEYTDFSVEAEVEQNGGALFHLEAPFDTKVRRVILREGYRNLQYRAAAGLLLEDVRCEGGKLLTPDTDEAGQMSPNRKQIGKAFKNGAFHIHAQEGGETQNNGIEYRNVRTDPVGDPVLNSIYEAGQCIRSMDGLTTWGGHFAGGCYAHVLLEATLGSPLNGITLNSPWIDAHALRTLQIQGSSSLSNFTVNGGVIQTGRSRNVSVENAKSESIHFNGVINEFAGSEAIYVANGNEFFLKGGMLRGNNTGPDKQTTIRMLATKNWEIDARVSSNNTQHGIYVGNRCQNGRWKGLWTGHLSAEAYDEGNNINCRRGEW